MAAGVYRCVNLHSLQYFIPHSSQYPVGLFPLPQEQTSVLIRSLPSLPTILPRVPEQLSFPSWIVFGANRFVTENFLSTSIWGYWTFFACQRYNDATEQYGCQLLAIASIFFALGSFRKKYTRLTAS
jgi:hypothetical protein